MGHVRRPIKSGSLIFSTWRPIPRQYLYGGDPRDSSLVSIETTNATTVDAYCPKCHESRTVEIARLLDAIGRGLRVLEV